MEDCGKAFLPDGTQCLIRRRLWLKVQLPFWPREGESGGNDRVEPVSLHIASLLFKSLFVEFSVTTAKCWDKEKLNVLSFQLYKQSWKMSHQASSSVPSHPYGQRISTLQTPVLSSSSSLGVFPFMELPLVPWQTSVHFSEYHSHTLIVNPRHILLQVSERLSPSQ